MVVGWLVAQLALAAEPVPAAAPSDALPAGLEGVRPVAAPASAEAEWREWAVKHGKPPSELACLASWPGFAELCFRIWEPATGDRRTRRWVTGTDLTGWRLTASALADQLAPAAAQRVASLARWKDVVGMSARYLEIADGDGWAAAALLAPDALAQRLGGAPIAVALPSDAVALAWKPGDDKVDLAMAVGVHDVFAGQGNPVTEVVHLWDGKAWSAWAVATPRAPAVAPPPGP